MGTNILGLVCVGAQTGLGHCEPFRVLPQQGKGSFYRRILSLLVSGLHLLSLSAHARTATLCILADAWQHQFVLGR